MRAEGVIIIAIALVICAGCINESPLRGEVQPPLPPPLPTAVTEPVVLPITTPVPQVTSVVPRTTTFLAGADEVRIEPGSEVKVGETVTISGLTILSPGNRILVEVYPVTFGPQPKGSSDPEGGGSGVVTVGGVPGGGPNRWSYSLNTTGFAPDTYLVTITGLDVPRYRGSGQILLYSTPGSM